MIEGWRNIIKKIIFISFLLLFMVRFGGDAGEFPTETERSPQIIVGHCSPVHLSVEIRIPAIQVSETFRGKSTFSKVSLPQTGSTLETGKPELPIVKFLLATPKGSEARLTVADVEYEIRQGYRVMPAQQVVFEGEGETEFKMDEEFYGRDEYYPKDIAILGVPAIMRDMQLVPVEVHPAQYNPGQDELKTYSVIDLEISCRGGEEIDSRKYSLAFRPLYESTIANYESLQLPDSGYQSGGYLIITPDEFYDAVQPLAEWKHRKGFRTTVSKISDVGGTVEQIRDHISDAYHTWDPPPDYVLLIGDTDRLPTYSLPSVPASDHYYSLLEGDDYFSEVLVGRLSVTSEAELNVVISKILGYERNPYLDETAWYKRALVVGGNYPEYVTTAVLTKKWVRDKLLAYGYSEVDTCFYPPTNDPGPITSSINSGVSLVNFRGWARTDGWHYPEFRKDNVYFLSNGWALPVVTSITCGTGNFSISVCFGEAWLRTGTPTNPKGAVGFIGPTSLQTSTKYNNCIDAALYQGILEQDIRTFGQALYKAKLEVFRNLPMYVWANQNPEFYFHTYNILGDPGLLLWTDIPESLSVAHSSTVPVGHSSFDVEVKDLGQNPVEDALVCLWKSDEIYDVDLTDEFGRIRFLIEPTTPETMWVTATSHNCVPYLGYSVVLEELYVGYYAHIVDDASGNGNGEVNPGETVNLEVQVKNYGIVDTTHDVSADLSTDDALITVINPSAQYGDIPPAGVSVGSYTFSVSHACTSNHQIFLTLSIESGDGDWIDVIRVPVFAPDLICTDRTIVDADSILDPGDTTDFVMTLRNRGSLEAADVNGILRSSSSSIHVIDSLSSFGDIAAGDTSRNSSDPFRISAPPDVAVGRSIWLTLELNGTEGFADRISLPVEIGSPGNCDPLGSDHYGYYAYDSNDTGYSECPDYEWIDIDNLGTCVKYVEDEQFNSECLNLWISLSHSHVRSYSELVTDMSGTTIFERNIDYRISHSVGCIKCLPPDSGGSMQAYTDYLIDYCFAPENDETVVVGLPFPFEYYGNTYDEISICSNGWLSLGSTWMVDAQNWHIPSALGPPCLIAPFWDELDLNYYDDSNIYYHYDSDANRFIVEWKSVPLLLCPPSEQCSVVALETFQVILCDPIYYPTQTGDGEIVFQYKYIENDDTVNSYATVGIENESHDDGLEYSYNNEYPSQASPLAPGLAIKFTTDRPDTFPVGVEEMIINRRPRAFSIAQNFPNPFCGMTDIRFTLASQSELSIGVYDISGRLVRKLIHRVESPGLKVVRWDGKDQQGRSTPAGVYFFRLQAISVVGVPETAFVKMILLK